MWLDFGLDGGYIGIATLTLAMDSKNATQLWQYIIRVNLFLA